MQTSYTPLSGEVQIHSKPSVEGTTEEWKRNVCAIIKNNTQVILATSGLPDLEAFKQRCTTAIDKQSVYWMMKLVGLKYASNMSMLT